MSIVSPHAESSASLLAMWKDVTEAQPSDMERQAVFLGMGSNLDDRRAMLQSALDAIGALPQTEIIRCSRIYETAPWGDIAQGPFYNCAAEIRTALAPEPLLDAIKNIEQEMGRIRVERNGPRIIDIDILFFGSSVLRQDGLVIPHPAMAERLFVLIPLREIAAGFMHPIDQVSIDELLSRCRDTGSVVDTGIGLTMQSQG